MSDKRRRIIVAEDEVATLKLLQRQLERAGYEVSAFGDGRGALEAISEMTSGIVLADWGMPEMDGVELCRSVRELEEMQALSNVYFILLTAHNTKEHVVQGLEAGANDYLTKPYHEGELLARIQVGERMLRLQDELLQRTLEYHKANTKLAILTNKLDEAANTDMLTGLASRRALFDQLEDAWDNHQRQGTPLSCVMCDVDKFKRVNDTYGHDAGDLVLKEVAGVLRKAVPRPHICGRLGGEEFLILCPGGKLEVATGVAEKLRQRISSRAIVHEDQELHVTVSCGAAEVEPGMARADELINRADDMLYQAKENGRNQTWALGPTGSGRRVTTESVSI